MNQAASPIQHLPSGALRRTSVGASPEPIAQQHPSGIASLPGHTKVTLSPPRAARNGGAQPQPQPRQRRSPERRQVLAEQQPYWAYSEYSTPAPQLSEEDDAPGAWDEFYSAMHNRRYCASLSRAMHAHTSSARVPTTATPAFCSQAAVLRCVSRRRDAPPDSEDGVARSYRAGAGGEIHSSAGAAAYRGSGRCCCGELEACCGCCCCCRCRPGCSCGSSY